MLSETRLNQHFHIAILIKNKVLLKLRNILFIAAFFRIAKRKKQKGETI